MFVAMIAGIADDGGRLYRRKGKRESRRGCGEKRSEAQWFVRMLSRLCGTQRGRKCLKSQKEGCRVLWP